MTAETHKRNVVVWDVPSAVACGDRFECLVGIKCEAGCASPGWQIDVLDAAGRVVASAAAGDAPWPGTAGLYCRRFELSAPAEPGLSRWQVVATAAAVAGPGTASEATGAAGAAHAEARASFNVRTVPEADCRLRVIAVERESGAPVAGLKVVVHPYRALTDATGAAELELPRGAFRLFVTGKDFFPFRCDGELDCNMTIRAELEHDPGPSDAELWS